MFIGGVFEVFVKKTTERTGHNMPTEILLSVEYKNLS